MPAEMKGIEAIKGKQNTSENNEVNGEEVNGPFVGKINSRLSTRWMSPRSQMASV